MCNLGLVALWGVKTQEYGIVWYTGWYGKAETHDEDADLEATLGSISLRDLKSGTGVTNT